MRKDITKSLSEMTEQLINPKKDQRIYWAREVTFDYGTEHAVRVDFMKFVPANNSVSGIEKGDFFCYEIKSSVEDFHSPHGHNFIGDFNYYVMPLDVFVTVSLEIPRGIGVYCPEGSTLKSVKKSQRQNRSRSVAEMLLMMFRSANREICHMDLNKQWIPVSTRLPTKEEYMQNDGRFIATDGNRVYQGSFDIYDGKFKCPDFTEDKCIIAWTNLPQINRNRESAAIYL